MSTLASSSPCEGADRCQEPKIDPRWLGLPLCDYCHDTGLDFAYDGSCRPCFCVNGFAEDRKPDPHTLCGAPPPL